ncbi:MAG: long-chain fatty acid--CoA ligase [Spirochaetes bacterium]|nr:long-chain fatty acid--CoA ligase [Spirochaetota bacterium]
MEYTHFSQIFNDRVKRYGERTALRYRDGEQWIEYTWRAFGEQADACARALLECGVGEQATVGIFSQNRPEWSIADVASLLIRAVPVAIYATDTAKQAEYIVNDSEISVLFVGDQDQYRKAMEVKKTNHFLKRVVVFNGRVAIDAGPDVMYFFDFLAMGRRSDRGAEIAQRQGRAGGDDLLCFIYTSGTTGEPKGVMLTHSNALFQAGAHDGRLINPNDGDVSLCFLPLSHVFERMWTYYVLVKGMTNVYLDDPSKIIDYIQVVKPTIMCAVPRFYEKIYAAINNKLASASPLKRALFRWSLNAGRKRNGRKKDLRRVGPLLALRYRIADRLVLSKMRALTGGRVRFFPCAGAPLSQEIEEFFYAMGIFICYGYGLSETSATVTCHEPSRFRFGLVGTPLPGVEVRIDDETGEIQVRGGNVMKGYYKKPDATAEVFTADGFFRTGDAGLFEDNGELRITDRIKDLMKTSGGKYIAPQLIESTVGADHLIEQVCIIGDQRKYVTAIIVPNFVNLMEHCAAVGIEYTTNEEMVKRQEIIDLYRVRIDTAMAEFARFERVKYFRLLPHEFTIESGEMTPTMKLKRKVIFQRYGSLIDSMYAGEGGGE